MKRIPSFILMCGICLGLSHAARPARADEIDDSIKKVTAADFGQEADAFGKVDAWVIASKDNAEQRKLVLSRMAAMLDDPKSTPAAKDFACRQLYRLGNEEAVPTIAKLLAKKETADIALYALERMTAPAAGAALRSALPSSEGIVRVGIINALGQRRDREALAAIAALTTDGNVAIAEAALAALGKIASPEAAASLKEARTKVSCELAAPAATALLACAAGLMKDGNTAEAEAIYTSMYVPKEAPFIRAAALKGLIAVTPQQAVTLIVSALACPCPIVRGAAGEAARQISTPDATEALAKAMADLKPSAQILLLHALKDRQDRKALPAVTAAAGSSEQSVRLAALGAIAVLGDSGSISLLIRSIGGQDPEAGAARAALNALKGADIDATIVQEIEKGDAKVKTELIRSLAARYAKATLPTLWKSATDADESVRVESFKALAGLATPQDIPQALALLTKESADGARTQAEATVQILAKRIKEPKPQIEAILAALPSVEGNCPGRCALIRILGNLHNEGGLDAILAALKSPEAKLKEVALRALADWKKPAPLAAVFEVVQAESPDGLRPVALQAYFRLLALPSDRKPAETVEMYKKGLALATRVEEKKLAITALGDVGDRSSVELVKQYKGDKDLAAEVKAALDKLMHRPRSVSASNATGEAKAAIDGDIKSRWSTNTPMVKGQWFQIDMGWESEITKITLDAGSSAGDFPRLYEVFVSNNPENWGDPVAKGEGKGAVTEIVCQPKSGRYVRIVQNGKADGAYWSIHELKVETKD